MASTQFPFLAGFLGPYAKWKFQRTQCVKPCLLLSERTDKQSPLSSPLLCRPPLFPSVLMTHARMIHASKPQTIKKRPREMSSCIHGPVSPFHALPQPCLATRAQGSALSPSFFFFLIFSFLGALTEGQEKPANRSLTFPFCLFELNPPACICRGKQENLWGSSKERTG